MGRNQKKTPTDPKRSHVISVKLRDAGDTEADAYARSLTNPETQAAATLFSFEDGRTDVNALVREMVGQCEAVGRGQMGRPEAMLVAQAHVLDEIFNHLSRKAHGNMAAGYLDAFERYLRLALKAQSQCRTTLESLAEIKNPRPVAFVRQANIANGPQQVNNGNTPALSRTRKNDFRPNELMDSVGSAGSSATNTQNSVESRLRQHPDK